MAAGHIFIYGPISKFKDFGDEVTLKDVVDQIAANKDADSLTVHINTVGGDVSEGFAIYDVLKNSSKKVTTVVEGLCASIGSVIFLAGEERQMTANSELMIHNPWAGAMGDADDLQEVADQLKETESKLVDFYASHTKQEKATLDGWMKEEKWMKPDEALSLGFATSVVNKMEVAASIFRESVLRKKDNSNHEIKEIMAKGFGKVLDMLNSIPGVGTGARNQVYTTASGAKFETDSPEALALENKVKDPDTGKALEDGEYVVASLNKKMKVEGGKVSALEEVETPDEESTEQMAQAMEKIAASMAKLNERLTAIEEKGATASTEALDKAVEEKVSAAVEDIKKEATEVFAQVRSKFSIEDQAGDLSRGHGEQKKGVSIGAMKQRKESYKPVN